MSVLSVIQDDRAKTPPPPRFSNELFGLFIESLEEDPASLRACSLVSSVFHHFCSPTLYRDIALDCREKVDAFLQLGERSRSIAHTKSLSLAYYGFETRAHQRKPRKILEIISRKASLEALRLSRVKFHAETFTPSLLSKLGSITALTLQDCRFGGFEDFVSFIRCFPRCNVLRLHCCTWIRDLPRLRFRGSPTHDLSLSHLEITSTSRAEWGEEFCDQGLIVGTTWLNLSGLKSFTYAIEEDTTSGPVLGHIAACEFLEELDMSVNHPGAHAFAINQLAGFIFRIKFLTLRCIAGLLPWWFSFSPSVPFPSSSTLERLRIITPGPFPMAEGCKVLDDTFSDIDRYPSLAELEICSPEVTHIGRGRRDTHKQLYVDEHLPRLRELGRLPPSRRPGQAGAVRPVDTFGSVAGAYYGTLA